MGLQYTSLKRAIQQKKILFDDELVAIASNPFTDINEAIFEVEFSNFLNGTAHRIYLDPREYFRKTHITEDMKNILKKVLSRVASVSDESYAIILDTTFGGGKTHTLLAIYHMFENKDVAINYQEVKGILKDLQLSAIPEAEIVAIDGHNVDPNENLWNVIGNKLDDANLSSRTTPPTAEEVENAIRRIGKPVIFLIDELVVYISKIAGDEARISQNKAFIHSMFVALDATRTSIVVLTIPESEAYKKETEIIRNLVEIAERGATKIAPISKEDVIRVLKKRFIKEVDENLAKEATKELRNFYITKLGLTETFSEKRLIECYPFNPELIEEIFFGRVSLYEGFQRTRGILKIMARVIVNLLRHVDELPESTYFISAGEVDLSDPQTMRKLTDRVFGNKLDQVVQTDIATAEGTAHTQIKDGKKRFGNFTRIATAVYLYSLIPEEPKKGANSKLIAKALGDNTLDPNTIDSYLEKLYDEIATHIFRVEGTDRYYFKTEENPRAIVRNTAKDVKDEEVKLHLQKQFIAKIIPSTETIAVNIFENEIKKDNTNPQRLNIFVIDYDDVLRRYRALKSSKEYESETSDVVAKEVYRKIFSELVSITTPNRNTIILLFPDVELILTFVGVMKELIACEKLKKERAKDKTFLRELGEIQSKIYSKSAQLLINMYSQIGFVYKNEQTLKRLTPATYDERAKYSERIFEDLKKFGKVLDSVSLEYVHGIIGSRDYIKFSEFISNVASFTGYPFVPLKNLKDSIAELVKNGEIAVYKGEICEPEDVDLEKSEDIVKNLKIGILTEVKDSDYLAKKNFAEQLLEVAKRKKLDKVVERILEVMGNRKYVDLSFIESELPDMSKKDIVDAISRSQKLEFFGGEISLIEKIEAGEKLSQEEAEKVLSAFGKGDYVFRKDFAEEIKKKLEIKKPPPILPPLENTLKIDELLAKFDELKGKKVKMVKISGKGSNLLKEDSLNVSGAVSFLSLKGKMRVNVKGNVVFECDCGLEKIEVVSDILKKISDLDSKLDYSLIFDIDAEITDDFRMVLDELKNTKSDKVLRVG